MSIIKASEGRHIYRYEIPVDDQWHTIKIGHSAAEELHILHVASRNPDTVELWAVDDSCGTQFPHTFRVFGTGQLLPDDVNMRHAGTALTAGGRLVWHLMERQP